MASSGTLGRLRRKWRLRRTHGFRMEVWREVAGGLRGALHLDRGGGPEDAVLIAGSGRSGTTWIAELLNHDNHYRYLHEPFRPNRLRLTRHFRPRQYLAPGDRDQVYLEPARRILSGDVRSLWTDKYNRQHLARKRLVKEVRGNLLLPWFGANFPATPLVLVLRHPCAVVASQLELAGDWRVDLGRFEAERELMRDHLEPFRGLLREAETTFHKHLLVWCIETYVPLRSFGPGDVHVAFYEAFLTDPEREIARLFEFVGRPFDRRVLEVLDRPSAVTVRDSAVASRGRRVDGWRRSVSSEQARLAERVLGQFGLDRLYGVEPLPRVSGEEALAVRPAPSVTAADR